MMRFFTATRLALAGLLALPLALLTAQAPDSARRGGSATPPPNPQLNLPYGATSADPVSRWTPPASAGRQLTLNDLLTWNTIRGTQLSNDGKWIAYELAPNEGDNEVVIRPTAANGTEWKFATGSAPTGGAGGGGGPGGLGGGAVQISGNSKWAAFLVRPSANAARGGTRGPGAGAGGGGAAQQPKLAIVRLGDGIKVEYENVRSFRFAGDTSSWLAIQHGGTGSGTMLELVNLAAPAGTPNQFIANVTEFAFDAAAQYLAYAIGATDEIGNSLQLRRLSNGETRTLDAYKAAYRRITWGDSSFALAALRVDSDTANTVDEIVAALVWPNVRVAAAPQVIDATTSGMPEGRVVSSDYAIAFSRDAGALYVGIRAPRPPRTQVRAGGAGGGAPGGNLPAPGAGSGGRQAAAPQTDADVPSLVLWHYQDVRVQSQQQVQESQDRSFVHVAAYQIARKTIAPLTDDALRGLQRGPRDTWGVASDNREYEREAGIRGFQFRDLYAVNLVTGERKLIQARIPGGGGGGFGGGAAAAFSPDNSRYAYYDTGDWKVYDFATGQTRTLTAGINNNFYNDEDDHNQVKPQMGGALVGWTHDNASLIVRDNWDYWRLPVSGTGARNLTVNGRRDGIRYQGRLTWDNRDRRGIDPTAPFYVETFEEYTKKEGLAAIDVVRGGVRVISSEAAKVDYRRARDANVWAYTRQTAVAFPDWYAAELGAGAFTGERRLTDANPQQTEVAWTAGTRLVEYQCEGQPGRRQATLYLPAGYVEGRTYPTLTYIYEKLTQGFNAYQQPNATRYANAAVYTSRGYAYLMPDITYRINDPGRSAVDCVVPAVQAAIATGIVDSARVGLQGHSWGGYQTTFITTQTNIFKTAVAGAPLTDMVSMFGSIYWNSGSTDASIFIASQGRFTGGPNDVPEAYLRNSPQVHAQSLSIPFMILHNDRDGAVDFNQGITYYNHLRQLGKEVVLLEYVGENHGLARPANQKDYALRMTEWFDTFLRDQDAPQWMRDGVPRLEMEAHLKARRAMTDRKAEPAPPI